MYARAARLETTALLDTLNTTNKMLARIAILSLIAFLAAATGTTTAPPATSTTGAPTTHTTTAAATTAPTTTTVGTTAPETKAPATATVPPPLPPLTPEATACLEGIINLFSADPERLYPFLFGSGLAPLDMGDPDLCEDFPAFHYCVLQQKTADTTTGLCVPRTCNQDALNELIHSDAVVPNPLLGCEEHDGTCLGRVQANVDMLLMQARKSSYSSSSPFSASGKGFHLNFPHSEIHCGDASVKRFDAGSVVMVMIICVLILLGFTQHALECGWIGGFKPEERAILDKSINAEESESDDLRAKYRPQGKLAVLLSAWSFNTNLTELFSSSPKRTLKALDGLRAISMFMIILGHTANFQLFGFVGFQNPGAVDAALTNWTFQFVAAASFAVDTFFFLSGLLTAYVVVRKMSKTNKAPPFGMAIVLRYLRLTPLLAFLVGLYAALVKHFGSGPLWFRLIDETGHCKHTWWANLLYINNFYPTNYKDQCIPWAWYLANDFQFYIVGLVILILYNFKPAAAKALTWLLTLVGPVATAAIVWKYDLTIQTSNNQDYIYDKPYTRISAYTIGILTAFLINSSLDQLRELAKPVAIAINYSSLAILCTIVYVTADFNWEKDPNWSADGQRVYLTLNRILFTTGVAGITTMTAAGHGSLLGWVLSRPFWEPLGKLTFGAYLVHPMIIRTVYYNRRQLFHFDNYELSVYFVGFMCMAYVMAMLLYIFVEMPAANLTNMLVRKKK